MPARSTRVSIHNESGLELHLLGSSLEGGDWTPDWKPWDHIDPGATVGLQSESDGLATGTEGRVQYRIGDGTDTIALHWDNPFVGTNTYDQSVTGPYGLYFEGGKGNNAELTYSLIPQAKVVVPGFLPSRFGFAFGNDWPDVHITSIPLPDPFGDIPVGNASWGLCGGMSFASRDYFEAGMHAPRQTENPTGEGDPLFDYIVRRLSESLGPDDIASFLRYADPLYPNGDNVTADGRSWTMAHEAWPQIKGVIDSGHPCPIGLVIGLLPDVTHLGHQVCVYSYQLVGQQLTLGVYDPNNHSNDEITMSLDISRTDNGLIQVNNTIGISEQIKCFFLQHYDQRDPLILPTVRSESGMAANARDPESLDAYWPHADGSVRSSWYRQDPSHNWLDSAPFPIAGPGASRPDGPVASVSRTTLHHDVFWIGPDGGIGSTWWDAAPGCDWTDHTAFGIAPSGSARSDSPIVTVARTANHLDVFWITPDGAIASQWWDSAPGCGWGDHEPFTLSAPGAAGPGSALTAVSRNGNHLDVFWVGTDGAVGTNWWDIAPGCNWSDHQPFAIAASGAAVLGSGLASVGRTVNHLDVFWIGPDGGIGSTWWDIAAGCNWGDHQPFRIAPAGAARPWSGLAALGRTPNQLDVFWIGSDGAIGSTWWNAAPGCSWGDHTPFAVTPPDVVASNRLAAVSRWCDRMDLFWVGGLGTLMSTYWELGATTNWGNHRPATVTGRGQCDGLPVLRPQKLTKRVDPGLAAIH